MADEMQHDVKKELKSFQDIWKGGYLEGDPLAPLSPSTYGRMGYMSILHAVYLGCIRPYVNSQTTALEIGPGRGSWTKAMLPAKEIWALDAKSREDNQIDVYLNHPGNLTYIQVKDFECNDLPDNHFDYMFSFGCFCHVSWEGLSRYAERIYPKLKSGANCFWMVGDYSQRNHLSENFSEYDVIAKTLPPRWFSWMEKLNKFGKYKPLGRPWLERLDLDEAKNDAHGRWHHAGKERTAKMLTQIGYVVITDDVGFALRDPILHFRKP